jgi:hypothetical protein
MKGRARQLVSNFYTFDCTDAQLSLGEMQVAEDVVCTYLSKSRPCISPSSFEIVPSLNSSDLCLAEAEELAVKLGRYATSEGQVVMSHAVGLVDRYATSTPMDPTVRRSRESFMAYMPHYDADACVLYLPPHISSALQRKVILPLQFHGESKLVRKQALALM